MKKKPILSACVLILLPAFVFAWAPEPDPAAFTLPLNQWTKIAEAPLDPLDREMEPGQGAYLCFFPDSGLFFRYGGYTPTENNELWSFSLVQRKWTLKKNFDYSWPPPSDRPGAGPWWSMAYDGKRRVIWMMCGSGTASKTHLSLYNDIWRYDPAANTFTKMNSTGFYHGAEVRIVYDSLNDRVLRAPAYDGEWSYLDNRDKTWCYNPNTNSWEGKSTPGSPKNSLAAAWVYASYYGKAVYLSRDTIVDSANCEKAVTWTYDCASNAWARLASTLNPPMRVGAAIAYDPVNRLVILHGGTGGVKGDYGYGYRGGGVVLEDTWALDLSTGQWSALSVGKPSIPNLKQSDGSPLLPQKPGARGRLVFVQASDFDTKNNALVVSSPCYGVWALRYKPPAGPSLPDLDLPALPSLPPVSPPSQVFPSQPLNPKLLDMPENKWIMLGGGASIGGDEIPLKFDPASGYFFKYGGCGDGGTTFASGYGNDLIAFDPAAERWFAVRATDPCGAGRPANGCTRFYAGDGKHGCTWFAGGTSGNYLSASVPQAWPGGKGTWRYVWQNDKYELVPNTGDYHGAIGVVCGYDPLNDLFMTVSAQNWGTVATSVFNSNTHVWSDPTTERHVSYYTYGDFIDSLGALGLFDAGTFWTVNGVTGAWDTLAYPSGYTPTGNRNTIAYDPYNNVVLAVGSNKTFAYKVSTQTWTEMLPDSGTPDLGEHLAFDRRHGVFIGAKKGSSAWAYKYKDVPGLKKETASAPFKGPLELSCAPNPFTPESRVAFSTSGPSRLTLAVYAPDGRLVRRLAHGRFEAGTHYAVWDGRNAQGRPVSAGVYYYRLEAGKEIRIVKAVLAR